MVERIEDLPGEVERLRRELEQLSGSWHDRELADRIIDAVADPVFVKDADHRWIKLNKAFCEFMGYDRGQLIGKSDYDFFPPDEAAVFWAKDDQVFGSGITNVNEERFTDSSGATHVISTKKSAFTASDGRKYLVGVIRDVTQQRKTEDELARYREHLEQLVEERTRDVQQHMEERRKAEEGKRRAEAMLARQQKLEALGRLAGGVAHDFNNVLTAIFGHVSLGLRDAKDGTKVHESLMGISEAARRAASLTRQLLAFGSRQVIEPRVIDPGDLLLKLRGMLERLIGEDIELVASVQDGLGRIRADPGQIEQVIVNLVVNARDAMPAGGTLGIRAENVTIGEGGMPPVLSLAPGDYVLLSVTDTGVGMSAELQKKVFEPFFTTKPVGAGTGLGLSTVYGIVQQHGGAIELHSEPARGACFRVYFPRVSSPSEDGAQSASQPIVPRGSESILLIEDDQAVREVTRTMLSGLGYRVLDASRGDEAIAICSRSAERVDLVLTDVVMPGISGKDLFDKLRALRPGLPVLFTSGYPDDALVRRGVLDERLDFLGKPYSDEALAKKIRGILDRQG